LRLAYVLTLVAVISWTTGPVGAMAALLAERDGIRLTPIQVAFWSIALGWVALVVAIAARGRWRRLSDVSWRGWLVLGAMGLFGWAGYSVALNVAYTMLSLPEAMIISYLNPVFVVLLQGAPFGALVRVLSGWEQKPTLERRPPVGRVAIGLLLCLLGVAFVATGGRLTALGPPTSVAGALAALFGALCWGVYSNLGRFVSVRPGRDPSGLSDIHNCGAMPMGLALMAAGLVLSGRVALPLGFRLPLYFASHGPAWVSAWVPLCVMALVNYGLGYTLWLQALERADRVGQAHRLPPLTYLVLVTAIGLGWLVLREPLGPGFWQGAALIAAGNAVVLWPAHSRKHMQ
jgi:drug/metabolite transporter (DMT)-like permease